MIIFWVPSINANLHLSMQPTHIFFSVLLADQINCEFYENESTKTNKLSTKQQQNKTMLFYLLYIKLRGHCYYTILYSMGIVGKTLLDVLSKAKH